MPNIKQIKSVKTFGTKIIEAIKRAVKSSKEAKEHHRVVGQLWIGACERYPIKHEGRKAIKEQVSNATGWKDKALSEYLSKCAKAFALYQNAVYAAAIDDVTGSSPNSMIRAASQYDKAHSEALETEKQLEAKAALQLIAWKAGKAMVRPVETLEPPKGKDNEPPKGKDNEPPKGSKGNVTNIVQPEAWEKLPDAEVYKYFCQWHGRIIQRLNEGHFDLEVIKKLQKASEMLADTAIEAQDHFIKRYGKKAVNA